MGSMLTAFLALQSCAACHEPEARAEGGGAHAAAASCVDCHGGDATAREKEPAHSGSYAGKISRAAIPGLCARCHSDVRRMNPFGLRTDPLAQYLTSKHGEAIARGDLIAAVCTDCHGVHGMKRATDPAGPIHATNVPATCGRCHADEALMKKHNLAADAPALYAAGVHGERLRGGDLGAPTCATCHGNHGATPPGVAEVGQVCGRCHARQRELFETSPHAASARSGEFGGCVVCHANHEIVRAAADIGGRCTLCHEAGDAAMKAGDRIFESLASSRRRLGDVTGHVERLTREGFQTDEERAMLEQARTLVMELPPLQHTLDAEKVGGAARSAEAALRGIESRLQAKERATRLRRLALVPLWAFLAAMAALFWAKRKEVERRGGA